MNITEFKGILKNLVEKNLLTKALISLKEYYKDIEEYTKVDNLILLVSRHESNENKKIQGIISEAEYKQEKSDIRLSILKMISGIPDDNTNNKDLEYKYLLKKEAKNRFGYFFFVIALIIIIGTVGTGFFLYTGGFIDKYPKLLSNPGSIDHWNTFETYLYYYNAPFTYTDSEHKGFKRKFLRKASDSSPVFKILFFRGRSPAEIESYRTKMGNFVETLREIYKNDQVMKTLLLEKVEVKVDTFSHIPKSSFFLTKIKRNKSVALVYIYQNKLIEREASRKVSKPTFGFDVLPYVATFGTRKFGSNKHFCLTSLGVRFPKELWGRKWLYSHLHLSISS